MKYSRSLVAAGVALALVAGPAVAKKNNGENSVYAWGRWSVLPVAAGGLHVALMPLSSQGTPRNSANTANIIVPSVPSVPSGPCPAGASCGFASVGNSAVGSFGGSGAAPLAAAYNGQSGQTFSYTAPGMSQPSPTMSLVAGSPVSGGAFGTVQYSGIGTVNGQASVSYSGISNVLPYGANGDVMYGEWQNGTYTFKSQVPGLGTISASTLKAVGTFSGDSGYFITGTTTGSAELANLQAGGVQAVYNGSMLNTGTAVKINVNFGPGTWSGTWSGGAHFTGFNATGAVTGANIVSQSLTSQGGGALSGTVQGAFYGSSAGTVGGTVNIPSVNDTGVFAATK